MNRDDFRNATSYRKLMKMFANIWKAYTIPPDNIREITEDSRERTIDALTDMAYNLFRMYNKGKFKGGADDEYDSEFMASITASA